MRKILVTVIAATSAAAMLSGASLAAASTRPAISGIAHSYEVSSSPTSDKTPVIVTGLFTAGGIDISTGPTTDLLKFPGGTYKSRIHGVRSKQTTSKKTCLFQQTARGRYTNFGGTGKYAGISGSGTFVYKVLAVLARNPEGKCLAAARPVTFESVLTAQGHVKL